MGSPTDSDTKKLTQAADARGEANAMQKVGAVAAVAGAGAWVAAEALPVALDVAVDAALLADTALMVGKEDLKALKNKQTWKVIGIAGGAVAVGAIGYAAYKHLHADKLEQATHHRSNDPAPEEKWADRVADAKGPLAASRTINLIGG